MSNEHQKKVMPALLEEKLLRLRLDAENGAFVIISDRSGKVPKVTVELEKAGVPCGSLVLTPDQAELLASALYDGRRFADWNY